MIRFHNEPARQTIKEQHARFKRGLPQLPDKQSDETASSGLPSYLGGGQSMLYPQAMPGQLESLAAQLSAGYGQPASAYMQQMDALYNPVGAAPSPAPAPVAPQPVAGMAPGAATGNGPAPSMLGLWGQKAGTRMSRGNR